MSQQCFYCSEEIEDRQLHYVTFLASNMEREEKLCDECYKDWLQGIKG